MKKKNISTTTRVPKKTGTTLPKPARKQRVLVVGAPTPDFSLASTDGGVLTLSHLKGKRVVLYFYPKDMTPGCTVEAHEFSAIAKKFASKEVALFGVSPDSIASHKKFIEQEAITFPLLSDEGHKVADAYGVWVEKSMYGKKYMGVERATFVIGPDGKLEQVYRKVNPEGHAMCVLGDLG